MELVQTLGFRAGLIAFGATVSFVIVQVLQMAGILHFPWDEILIFGTSLCIVLPFVFEILALHYNTPRDRKIWSHAALFCSIIYAVFVIANYVVQLATVIPGKITNPVFDPGVLEQSPHSMFWDFDGVGYIFMGLTTLAAVPALGTTVCEKKVKKYLLTNALVTPLVGFVYFYPDFSNKLLFLASPWAITAPLSMLQMAMMFRRMKESGCDVSAVQI